MLSGGADAEADGSAGEGGRLAPDERALVALSAALAAREREPLREALEGAGASAAPEAVEEVLVQSYLFLGYPAALNALALWREISGRESGPPAPEEPELWRRRGEEVCRAVYGDQLDALRENVRGLHPDLERWMLVEGYGKVLGRPHLPLRIRELCVAALLAVLDTPVQLYSHLRGAVNVGAAPDEVTEALEVASGYMTDEARRTAEAAWARLRERSGPP